ncbi:MAG: Hsp20/alpha crystallin family protein [Firmicutes bacterium]|nr:Hsp20/alpha crystallin family protein [Bacillota bacterium]HXL03614.1 Hsp20/alpha crystallin family protein [Bacillota bacterium]
MALMSYDPWKEISEMRRALIRMFGDDFGQTSLERQDAHSGLFMPVDIAESGEEFVVTAELPGMSPEDIKITVVDNQVTIEGQREQELEEKHGNCLRSERRFGRFSRSFVFSSPIDDTEVSASYKNGILEVRLPKSEGAKAKQIEIRTE